MKPYTIFLAIILFSLPVTADDTDTNELGDRVTGTTFVERFQGDYLIELANGAVPEPTNRNAKIAVDEEEIILTFPFCVHGSACDPGYLFFPIKTVEVFHKVLGQEREVFTIMNTEDGKKLKYTLEIDGSKLSFTNYQYTTPNQQTITLVHVVKKASQ